MTPAEVAAALTQPYREPTIAVQLRTGLRLEQIVAQAGTIDLPFTQRELLDLLRTPPAELIVDYDWLDLPRGGTLEETRIRHIQCACERHCGALCPHVARPLRGAGSC